MSNFHSTQGQETTMVVAAPVSMLQTFLGSFEKHFSSSFRLTDF
jgi:hypothetical protein